MNPYEMTFIIRPDLDDEQTRAAVDQVTGRVESAGGEIVATYHWNPTRRRMAFPIRDFGDGVYVTTIFDLNPPVLRDVENALKLNDNVLRFLVVRATEQSTKQVVQRAQQQAAAAAAPPIQAQRPAPATAEEAGQQAAAVPSEPEIVEPEPAEAATSAEEAPAGSGAAVIEEPAETIVEVETPPGETEAEPVVSVSTQTPTGDSEE